MARALVDTSCAPHHSGTETLEGWSLVDIDLLDVELVSVEGVIAVLSVCLSARDELADRLARCSMSCVP